MYSDLIFCHLPNIVVPDISDNGNFPCPRCSRMYKHRASLNSHLKLECGVEPQFRCMECGRQFTWKQHLKRHMANVHKLMVFK